MSISIIWSEAMEYFGYPNIKFPMPSYSSNTGFIDMANKSIFYNPEFIDSFKHREKALKGLLEHEINHYVHLPFDLVNVKRMHQISKKEVGDKNIVATNLYCDQVVNIDLLSKKRNEVLYLFEHDLFQDQLMHTFWFLQAYKTSNDVTKRLEFHKELFDKIKDLDYSTNSFETHLENLKKFSKEIEPYLEDEQEFMCQIRKGDEDHTKGYWVEKNAVPEFMDDESARKEYEELAKKITLPIEKQKDSCIIGFNSWDLSTPFNDVDIYKSNNRFLPGISIAKKEYLSRKEMNDAFIMIDSSASMPNPWVRESIPVALGLYIANKYLSFGKEVAVLNFSEENIFLDYSKDADAIKREILRYQEMETFIEDKKSFHSRPADYYLITDLLIQNLDSFLYKFRTLGSKLNIFSFEDIQIKNSDNLVVKYVKGWEDLK